MSVRHAAESAARVILNRLVDLLGRVHDERPMPDDWLVDRFSAQNQQCRGIVRFDRHSLARAVERCEARKVGRQYRVVLHAEVDPAMPVADAHALTGQAKAVVRNRLPEVSSLLIHVEPHRTRSKD